MHYQELEELAMQWKGKVCIVGAGMIGKTWGYDLVTAAGFEVDFYYDNHIPANRVILHDISTISFEEMLSYQDHILIWVAASEKNKWRLELQLKNAGFTNIIILDYILLHEVCESVLETKNTYVHTKYQNIVDDTIFLKRQFAYRVGYQLNLDEPKTLNEKLQWLKLYDRKAIYTTMVDKYEVKDYVANLIGEEYIIPTIAVLNDFDSIDVNQLPQQFVIKCTHDSGSVIVCKDKTDFDWHGARQKIERALKRNFYWVGREWPYKNVIPRIMIEQYLADCEYEVLPVYKFFCFSGKPELVQLIQNDKQSDECVDFYDLEWNKLELQQIYPNSSGIANKPEQLEEMIQLATRLSAGYSFIRIDFYVVNGQVKFSEYTFYTDSGFGKLKPEDWDWKLGEKIMIGG